MAGTGNNFNDILNRMTKIDERDYSTYFIDKNLEEMAKNQINMLKGSLLVYAGSSTVCGFGGAYLYSIFSESSNPHGFLLGVVAGALMLAKGIKDYCKANESLNENRFYFSEIFKYHERRFEEKE
jgi:hypothetical protein